GLLVLHRFGWSAARHWWMGIDGASKAVLAAAAAGGLLIFALVLAQFLLPLSRLFEGYWKEGKPGRWLAVWGESRQLQRWDKLDQRMGQAAYLRRYQRFPVSREQVMATQLGNVMRAAE